MSKPKLKIETRVRALELATEIAAEAAGNTNVVWMIEFQEELLERIYRKMIALLEEGSSEDEDREHAKKKVKADTKEKE